MTQHAEAAREELPGELRTAVADTLDAYDQPLDGPGRDELEVGVARIHCKIRTNIRDINHAGPHAYNGSLLAYSIPRPEWANLCDSVKVYAKARNWTAKVFEHAADRVAGDDPCVSHRRVRTWYADDDRYPVVVQHP